MLVLLFQVVNFHLYLITIYLHRLSFALAASKIKEKARVVAMDLRGHGKSSTENELNISIEVCMFWDLPVPNGKSRVLLLMYYHVVFCLHILLLEFKCYSYLLQTLCDDVVAVLKTLFGDTPPAIILVGHRLPKFSVLPEWHLHMAFLIKFYKHHARNSYTKGKKKRPC